MGVVCGKMKVAVAAFLSTKGNMNITACHPPKLLINPMAENEVACLILGKMLKNALNFCG
jgi:hypothetical protein